ncbi:MAG: 2-hydroxyacyl-CoA dehydratase [Clostridia bacterium]|nr:2-hydroxyacyl-CoA dehydratase [Clostridia bacterium]
MMALAARSSKELFNAWLKDRLPSWEEAGRLGRVVLGQPLPGTAAVTGNRTGPRILLSGSILPPGLVAMLEECGATVVADDLCCGARYLGACREEEVAAADADPFTYLAALYLNRTPCPRMREAEDRWEHLVRMVREYRTDGVVFYSLKFCDFHHYAFPRLRQRLQQSGIPVLRLETEYTPQMSGQWRTRVEAFLESLAGGSGCPAAGRGR